MPTQMLGLIEMLMVLTLALGWGFYELRSLRHDRKPKPKVPPPGKDPPAR